MAAPVKKKRLHELDKFNDAPTGGVLLFSKGGKEYQLEADKLTAGQENKVYSLASAGNGVSFDTKSSNDYNITLNDASVPLTIVNSNNLVESVRFDITLTLVQGTGANKVVWPANVKWPNGAEPPLSYTEGVEDIFILSSTDKGVTWKGIIVALGY